MAALWSHAICCFLLLVLGRSKDKGLEEQLYEEAKNSQYLTEVISHGDALEQVLHNPTAPYVLVMFHVATCHICHDALPALESLAAAWSKAKEPIVAHHIDVTDNQDYWKKRYSFAGFPNLLLWHRPEADLGEKAQPLLDFVKTVNNGANDRLLVTKNESLLLDASRKAKMAEGKDKRRLEGLGQPATVERVELQDFTARLQVDGAGMKTTWYPLEALSYEDGRPVMRFERPDNPVLYRPTSWTKDAMKDFATRMMRPAVIDLKTVAQLTKEMKDEPLAAIVLCAGKIDDSPSFPAFAKSWQDKHRAYLASSKEACPLSGGSRPQLLVYSASHHQWSSQGLYAVPAVAVAGADIAVKDATALSAWFDMHRFPGIWNVSYENFHLLINAQRGTTVVAVDKTKKAELGKIEKIVKDVARPVASKAKGEPDVWLYSENTTYWGAVDGKLNGLDQFGVLRSDLPRVVVFLSEDGSRQWIEDVHELSVWNLSADLQRLPEMVRFSNEGARGFFMTRFYKPYRTLDRFARIAGGMPGRFGVAAGTMLTLFMCLHKLGKGAIWLTKMLMGDDGEEAPTKKATTKKKN